MHNEVTAIIEKDEDWYFAYCPGFCYHFKVSMDKHRLTARLRFYKGGTLRCL